MHCRVIALTRVNDVELITVFNELVYCGSMGGTGAGEVEVHRRANERPIWNQSG
jgi:hypothetical protein